ncbi:MAG: two-component system chemotaxis sensor kinase CheA [Myxococcota bacterium]|jgi:two-component system chemotaxis sensor kinase CheA
MLSLLATLRLPKTPTAFEAAHVARMNRGALLFFWLNVPLLVAVAHWNKTGVGIALGLACLTLFGSTLSAVVWREARITSVIHGITAMCLGGLLVHFGQGPMQMEMHFYFFSLLAMLAIFGNPMVIVAAGVTVVLHHVLVWAIIPDSVFNYDASAWVVAVHAMFVALESVAAIFLARSYFDNVIGLERIVNERTQELDRANRSMRLVLENVSEGLVTVDREGRLSPERSAKAREWLGGDDSPAHLSDRVRRLDPRAGEWLEIGWQDLVDGFMPVSVILGQLPKHITCGEQLLAVSYIPIGDTQDDRFDRMLLVMSDVSAEVARREAEAKQRQLLALIQTFSEDRIGFQAFYDDSAEMMRLLQDPARQKLGDVQRWLHTLKGNALSYKMDLFGHAVHELESKLSDEHRSMTRADAKALNGHWQAVYEGVAMITDTQEDGYLKVPSHRAAELESAITDNRDPSEILNILRSMSHQPVSVRLDSIAQQARRIAARICLKDINIVVKHHDIQIPNAAYSSFWSSLVHVVRNALDHGVEPEDERLANGKPVVGTLTLRAEIVQDWLEISVGDDGRGIDWDAVRARAAVAGLININDQELVEALFHDGLSTRDGANEMSGRGIGMSAVRQACRDCGGFVQVSTSRHEGTTFTFRFPKSEVMVAAA